MNSIYAIKRFSAYSACTGFASALDSCWASRSREATTTLSSESLHCDRRHCRSWSHSRLRFHHEYQPSFSYLWFHRVKRGAAEKAQEKEDCSKAIQVCGCTCAVKCNWCPFHFILFVLHPVPFSWTFLRIPFYKTTTWSPWCLKICTVGLAWKWAKLKFGSGWVFAFFYWFNK